MALASGYFVKTGALALIELNAMDNFDTKLARLDATGVRLGHWVQFVATTMENQALYMPKLWKSQVGQL